MKPGRGTTLKDIANRSFLRLRSFDFIHPKAADDDLIVTTVDPSSKAVGSTFTLAVSKLKYGRKVTMTLNDDDGGGGLSLTVLLEGLRWGMKVSETLTATSTDTNDITVTSTNVYDEITRIQVTAVTADSGDDVTFGVDGTTLGLPFPVDRLEDVFQITESDNGTEQATTAISSTSFSVAQSAIIGLTIAATDVWHFEGLISDRDGSDGIGTLGRFGLSS
jgi:hypothetical protein